MGEDLSITICGYEFEGPYQNIDEINDTAGIYVVLCYRTSQIRDVLYIGTAGERPNKDGQGVQRRLKTNNQKSFWMEHCKNGLLAYAVMYIQNKEKRLSIEKELPK